MRKAVQFEVDAPQGSDEEEVEYDEGADYSDYESWHMMANRQDDTEEHEADTDRPSPRTVPIQSEPYEDSMLTSEEQSLPNKTGNKIDDALSSFEYFASKYGVAVPARPLSSSSGRSRSLGGEAAEVKDDKITTVSGEDVDDLDDDLPTSVDIEHLMKTKREELQQLDDVSHAVEENKSLSDRFRAELESYLDTVTAKTDDTGRPLVSIPPNFDAVVNVMTREDLFDNDNNNSGADVNEENAAPASEAPKFLNDRHKEHQHQPWYQYLLSDAVDKQLDKAFDGRYHSVLTNATRSEESKWKQGMAEILLMDRQLHQLSKHIQQLDDESGFQSKRSKRLQKSSLTSEHLSGGQDEKVKKSVMEENDELSETASRSSEQSTTSSATSASTSKRGSKHTFLTSKHGNRSATSTPRSARLAAGHPRDRNRAGLDDVVTSHTAVDFVEELEDMQRQEVIDGEGDDNDNGIDGSKPSRINANHLTALQALRMRELIETEDDQFEEELLADYLPPSFRIEDERLSKALLAFGREDRLHADEEYTKEQLEQEKTLDFLALQRKERKQKEADQKLESMLSKCTEKYDYRSLVGDTSLKITSHTDHSSHGRACLYSVPALSEVHSESIVSMADIHHLIDSLAPHYDSCAVPSATTSSEPLPPMASADQMQVLLRSLHVDVERLALLRRQQARLRDLPSDDPLSRNEDNDRPAEEANAFPLSNPLTAEDSELLPESIASVIERELGVNVSAPVVTQVSTTARGSRIPRRQSSSRESARSGVASDIPTPPPHAQAHNKVLKESPRSKIASRPPAVEVDSELLCANDDIQSTAHLKAFDVADLQMLKAMLKEESKLHNSPRIVFPRIDSAVDPDGNRPESLQATAMPILPPSRRVQTRSRPSSNTAERRPAQVAESHDFVQPQEEEEEEKDMESRSSLVNRVREFVEC